ncbi:MAG: GNAT family N-acetyltransferase [Candidatus Omnitrophica bacterium]|nr:GNAT family N-acetyltransferase [Candidatus Omnitrophota bacterium]
MQPSSQTILQQNDDTGNIVIRPGRPQDAADFSRLVMYTAPEYYNILFGPDPLPILQDLFRHPNNLFSYQHTYFMECDGEVAGMTLFYDHSAKERGLIPFLILLAKNLKWHTIKKLFFLIKMAPVFARIKKTDMYSSNSALYPKFRARGLGAKLFSISENQARVRGLKRVVVNVKNVNTPAISLRRKLGFEIERKLPTIKCGSNSFEYLQMVKYL